MRGGRGEGEGADLRGYGMRKKKGGEEDGGKREGEGR